jgi:hypothetical protein
MKPVLFISYSHKDEELKEQLLQQLRVLESAGLLEIWLDDQISPGANWLDEINKALLQADIAVLLVTSSFLTSKFIQDREVPALLERRKAGGLSLFPIIGLPCAWQEIHWLSDLNLRPKNGTPVWQHGFNSGSAPSYLAQIAREIARSVRLPLQAKPPIRNAVQTLEKSYTELLSSSDRFNYSQYSEIKSIIDVAINHGAPLYNAGNVEGCVEIYYFTARRLLSQLYTTLPQRSTMVMMSNNEGVKPMGSTVMRSPMMDSKLTADDRGLSVDTTILMNAINDDLYRTLEYVEQARAQNPDIAWDLRDCFDRILLIIDDLDTITALTSTDTLYSGAEKRSKLRQAMSMAVRTGLKMYSPMSHQKLPDDRASTLCAAFFLIAALRVQEVLSGNYELRSQPSQVLAYSILDRIISENKEVTVENAYRISWDVRLAFEQYLH